MKSRHRRWLILCTVVGLAITAGCLGIGGGSDTGTNNTAATQTQATTDSDPADSSENSGKSLDSGDDGGEGEITAKNLEASTIVTLYQAGSYTETISTTITKETEKSTVTNYEKQVRRVNTQSERGLKVKNINNTYAFDAGAVASENTTETTYTTANKSYQRRVADGNVSYNLTLNGESESSAVRPLPVTQPNVDYQQFIKPFSWQFSEATKLNGEPVAKYKIADVSNPSLISPDSGKSAVNASGTLFVSSNDTLLKVEIKFDVVESGSAGSTGTQQLAFTVRTTYALHDIGGTTVTEPEWVSNAPAVSTGT